jgi:hypothetical protein
MSDDPRADPPPADRARPAWKARPQTAGAMMLLKGYAPPVTVCDACRRSLTRADGLIDVRFRGSVALYDCPHCGAASERTLGAPGG